MLLTAEAQPEISSSHCTVITPVTCAWKVRAAHRLWGVMGVETPVKLQACFLGSGYEAVGRGLVARNVHIASGSLYFAFNLVKCERRMRGCCARSRIRRG